MEFMIIIIINYCPERIHLTEVDGPLTFDFSSWENIRFILLALTVMSRQLTMNCNNFGDLLIILSSTIMIFFNTLIDDNTPFASAVLFLVLNHWQCDMWRKLPDLKSEANVEVPFPCILSYSQKEVKLYVSLAENYHTSFVYHDLFIT